jgi:hypothetical protein
MVVRAQAIEAGPAGDRFVPTSILQGLAATYHDRPDREHDLAAGALRRDRGSADVSDRNPRRIGREADCGVSRHHGDGAATAIPRGLRRRHVLDTVRTRQSRQPDCCVDVGRCRRRARIRTDVGGSARQPRDRAGPRHGVRSSAEPEPTGHLASESPARRERSGSRRTAGHRLRRRTLDHAERRLAGAWRIGAALSTFRATQWRGCTCSTWRPATPWIGTLLPSMRTFSSRPRSWT